MIETLPPNRTDQPLDVGVLPGRPRRRQHFLDPHTLQTFPEAFAVGAVVVADQVTRRRIVGECLFDLASDPFRGRVERHVEVGDTAAVVA